MPHLIRVTRGNVNEAFRRLNRCITADNQAKYFQRSRFNIKPCQRRRQQKQEVIYRKHRSELMQNLRAIFARKSRGF